MLLELLDKRQCTPKSRHRARCACVWSAYPQSCPFPRRWSRHSGKLRMQEASFINTRGLPIGFPGTEVSFCFLKALPLPCIACATGEASRYPYVTCKGWTAWSSWHKGLALTCLMSLSPWQPCWWSQTLSDHLLILQSRRKRQTCSRDYSWRVA